MALYKAVYQGDQDTLNKLASSGWDLGATNRYGRTALMDAVKYFRRNQAKFLVEKMTAKNLMVLDTHGYNVLHIMAIEEIPWPEVMQDIYNKCPEIIQQLNRNNRRPIDVAREMQCKDPKVRQYVCDILAQLDQRVQQQQQYAEGIADNMEQPCNITITVVGHHGVGKSCFVQQLKQENIPVGGPGSTDTANFYVNYLGYNPNTGFRQKLDEDGEIETGRQRLKRIIDRFRNEEETAVQSPGDKSDHHDDKNEVSSSTLNLSDDEDDPYSNVPVCTTKKKRGIKYKVKQLFSKFHFRRKTEVKVKQKEIPQDQGSESSSDDEVYPEVIPQEKSSKTLSSPEKNVIQEIPIGQRSVIDAVMHTKANGEEEVKGLVTIYDFGGEKVFYNTHHCFMSSNMIFVLVFDVAMCLDPCRQKDGYERIEVWLKSIATYAAERAALGKGTPPVILVGSHLDRLSNDTDEQERLFGSVLAKLYEKAELRDIMESHVQEMFPIADLNDSTKNQGMYQQIWETIIKIAPLQSQWMKPVPARWVAFEHELVRKKKEGKVILTYKDLLEINRELVVPLIEEDIIKFLWKLKFFGSFLCFDLHSKRPFIVLQAQWIIDAFKAIITDPKFLSELTVKQGLEWTNYQASGVLPIEFIRQLWGRYEKGRFLEDEKTLFTALETLGLLAKPLSVDTEVNYFLVPCFLQTAAPEIIRPMLDDPDTVTSAALCLKFDNPFIPQAVWDKMLAACINSFQQLEEPGMDGSKFIQRGFACLEVTNLWRVIICCKDNAMKMTMFTRSSDHEVLRPGTGISLRTVMQGILMRILQMNQQGHLGYKFYLHNDYRFTSEDKMVALEDLYQRESVECYGSDGHGWIHRKDMYVWFEDENQEIQEADRRYSDKTEHLPDRNLSPKEIGRLSRYIRGSFLTFFVELSCPVEIVEQEMEEHRYLAFRSRITKVFLHLLKINVDVSFRALAGAMSSHGMDSANLMNIFDSERSVNTVYDEILTDTLLQQCLSIEDASNIAEHVDIKSYFNLFLELGFSPAKVDDFDDQYRHVKTREKVTAMLEAFIKETNPCPTVNSILLAMQECDMDFKSLILTFKPKSQ